MKTVRPIATALILQLLLLAAVPAVPPALAQTEIMHLLSFVEASGCDFYRNGRWYDSQKAQQHLRGKYDHLAAANRIDKAEDFIEKAATRSSLSGESYQVRCSGGVAISTNLWLHVELNRYRTHAVNAPPT